MSALRSDRERYRRRLSDKIQTAFDHACEIGELEAASELLETLEVLMLRTPPRPERREAVLMPLVECHQRLWWLRAAATGRLPASAGSAA